MDNLLIFLAPLCVLGGILGFYIVFFKMKKDWNNISGQEVKVSAIFGFFSKNNLNAAIKLLDDKIALKLLSIDTLFSMKTYVFVNLADITSIIQKDELFGKSLKISTKKGVYRITANDDSINTLLTYFRDRNFLI